MDDNEGCFAVAVILLLILSIAFLILLGVNGGKKEIACQDAGYIGYDRVGKIPVCYGYVDQNKLVVIEYSAVVDDR